MKCCINYVLNVQYVRILVVNIQNLTYQQNVKKCQF